MLRGMTEPGMGPSVVRLGWKDILPERLGRDFCKLLIKPDQHGSASPVNDV